MTRIDDATLAAIEQELGTDGVWVAPQLRNEVSKADEAKIEAAVGKATTPTYVTLVELDYEDPLTHGDAAELANYIRDDTGRSGIYIGVGPQYEDPQTLELTAFPDDSGLFYAARVASAEHPDDLAAQTLRTLELLDSGDAQQLYEELEQDDRSAGSTSGGASVLDDDGGSGVVVGIGTVIVVLVGLLVAAVVVARRRRGRALPPSPTRASFTLPPAVLSTVRAAEDERNERRAQDDVLALGEAIDDAELDPRRAKGLPAWQAALDHYDVARRILDRDHSPADAVGAIVLAGRGRSALTAALRGRGWSPAPSCYFNPLHTGVTTLVRWRDGDAAVRVPACPACAGAVRSGDEPDDVLDFVADGRPAHYFKLRLGAWSETGYGALDTDLLGQLLRSGRRARP